MTSPTKSYFASSIEIADLGGARYDQETAAIGDRDYSLVRPGQAVAVQAGRAPKGLESQVFAWNTFQYTTEERNEKEELKGEHDVHSEERMLCYTHTAYGAICTRGISHAQKLL